MFDCYKIFEAIRKHLNSVLDLIKCWKGLLYYGLKIARWFYFLILYCFPHLILFSKSYSTSKNMVFRSYNWFGLYRKKGGAIWVSLLKSFILTRNEKWICVGIFLIKIFRVWWLDDVAHLTRFCCNGFPGRYKSSPLTIILVPRIKASGRANSG